MRLRLIQKRSHKVVEFTCDGTILDLMAKTKDAFLQSLAKKQPNALYVKRAQLLQQEQALLATISPIQKNQRLQNWIFENQADPTALWQAFEAEVYQKITAIKTDNADIFKYKGFEIQVLSEITQKWRSPKNHLPFFIDTDASIDDFVELMAAIDFILALDKKNDPLTEWVIASKNKEDAYDYEH